MVYRARGFNDAFKRALQQSLTYAELIQFLLLTPIPVRSILIVLSHLRLRLPRGLFSVGLTVKILKDLITSFILATCPADLNLLDLIAQTILGELSTL